MAATDDDSLFTGTDGRHRCWWCAGHDDYQQYHDEEWGNPAGDDCQLFEKVCLEGFQSGLSWLTILRKRDNFRKAFDDFDFNRIARFTSRRQAKLMNDSGIVRNRAKIEATINNAKRAREMVDEFGSLAAWFWQFEPPENTDNVARTKNDLCTRTTSQESILLAKELKKRGWKFFGPTTAYAFMQAMGMVNDHLADCCCYGRIKKARKKFKRPRL